MKDESRIEIGGECPKISSWFFPNDPDSIPEEMPEPKEQGHDSPQSS